MRLRRKLLLGGSMKSEDVIQRHSTPKPERDTIVARKQIRQSKALPAQRAEDDLAIRIWNTDNRASIQRLTQTICKLGRDMRIDDKAPWWIGVEFFHNHCAKKEVPKFIENSE